MSRKHKGKKKRGATARATVDAAPTVTSLHDETVAAEPISAASTAASTDAPKGRARSPHGVVARRLVIVSLAHLGCLALVLSVAALGSPKAQLTGFDLATLPAEPVTLHAKLELAGPEFFRPVAESISLDFFEIGARDALPGTEEGKLIDSALTNSDGSATVAITAPELPGHYFYRVALTDRTQVSLVSPSVFLVVSVARADRPIIITSIGNVLCETQLDETALVNPGTVAPLEGAQAVLSEKSNDHLIVYLSARPTRLIPGARNWLATHNFPIGPLLFRDVSVQSSARLFVESSYKATLIRTAITARWTNVEWGIGSVESDAQAYRTNEIQPILVDPQPLHLEAAASATPRVASWDEIRELLRKENQ